MSKGPCLDIHQEASRGLQPQEGSLAEPSEQHMLPEAGLQQLAELMVLLRRRHRPHLSHPDCSSSLYHLRTKK